MLENEARQGSFGSQGEAGGLRPRYSCTHAMVSVHALPARTAISLTACTEPSYSGICTVDTDGFQARNPISRTASTESSFWALVLLFSPSWPNAWLLLPRLPRYRCPAVASSSTQPAFGTPSTPKCSHSSLGPVASKRGIH